MQFTPWSVVFSLIALVVSCSPATSSAADEKEKQEKTVVELGEGKLTITAPAEWKKVQPKSRIIEYEFATKSATGDKEAGRVTIMGAGGSVEDNIKRWIGQFSQADGSDTKDKAKVEKKTIGASEVHFVDLSGTYKDMPAGPFAGGKAIDRPDYRMLAAIVVTKSAGNYFVKFYGPAKTVAENEKAFKEMMESVKEK
jgi:hypothetical protein